MKLEMSQSDTDDRLNRLTYTVNEACRMLSIGRSSLYDLVKSGDLQLVKIAGRSLVPRSELERLTRVDRTA